MKWLKRWHKISYRELWYLHYGGYHEGDKGCQREYSFLAEVTSGWQHAFQSEKSLRLEVEQLLRDNDIPIPTETRWNELQQRLKAHKENGTVLP